MSALQLWEVTFPAHRCERWDVPARTIQVGEISPEGALRLAARLLHIETNMPAFRSLVAVTVACGTVRAVEDPRRYVPKQVR